MQLKRLSELAQDIEQTLTEAYAHLALLLPGAEVHHIGATSIPGAITKGDVDLLVRISPEQFASTVETLKQRFEIMQPTNWTAEFASFGDERAYPLPLGIQVAVRDSNADLFLFLRDYLISHSEALDRYNQLKLACAAQSADEYWAAKDSFFTRILELRNATTSQARAATH